MKFNRLDDSARMCLPYAVAATEFDLWYRYRAALSGLQIVGRFPPGPSRARHTARVMGNKNRLLWAYIKFVRSLQL